MIFGKGNRGRFAAAAGVVILLQACTPRSEPEVEPKAAPSPPPAAPAIPTPPPPLGRAELLQAVEAAQAAYAAGEAYPAAAAGLADRRFSVRLPFGCHGPSAEDGYTFDAERRTLRLSVAPRTWTEAAWARDLVGTPTTETIEGFWIRRPWLPAESCPAVGPTSPALEAGARAAAGPADADAAVPAAPRPMAADSPETVGLAQVFEKGGSRLQRRGGRAYEVTRKLEADEVPGVGGFRLVLEGRIAPGPDNRPVNCRGDNPDRRPVCLVRVELERVAFENAGGEMLAEWRN